jgi:hypothetical protein
VAEMGGGKIIQTQCTTLNIHLKISISMLEIFPDMERPAIPAPPKKDSLSIMSTMSPNYAFW